MKTLLRIFGHMLLIAFLTVLTQVGGAIWLLSLPLMHWVGRKGQRGWKRRAARIGTFLLIYLLGTLLVVPPLAKRISGRVPMPWLLTDQVQPQSWFFPLLNRHYVRPPLRALITDAAQAMQASYPGTTIAYLDANFPFWDEFPLLPHRSHDDGKKLDVAFLYQDVETSKAVHGQAPTWLAYGGIEGPRPGEWDQPAHCVRKGYWQYDLLSRFTWQREDLVFDQKRNRTLIRWLATQPQTGKIFIEPHLKTRLGLGGYGKVRFHGCPAVRHDDHIHLQL